MEAFANSANADKDHSQSSTRPVFCWIRIEPVLIITIDMAQQLVAAKSFIDESFNYKLGRTQQLRCRFIFRFLNLQNPLVIFMFMTPRQRHSYPVAFLLNDFVCEASICVRPLEYGRNSQFFCGFERSQ